MRGGPWGPTTRPGSRRAPRGGPRSRRTGGSRRRRRSSTGCRCRSSRSLQAGRRPRRLRGGGGGATVSPARAHGGARCTGALRVQARQAHLPRQPERPPAGGPRRAARATARTRRSRPCRTAAAARRAARPSGAAAGAAYRLAARFHCACALACALGFFSGPFDPRRPRKDRVLFHPGAGQARLALFWAHCGTCRPRWGGWDCARRRRPRCRPVPALCAPGPTRAAPCQAPAQHQGQRAIVHLRSTLHGHAVHKLL
jgi:hypothetical protein